MSSIRVLMVVGENHKDLVKQYSKSNGDKTHKVVLMRKEDAQEELSKHRQWGEMQLAVAEMENDEAMIDMYSNILEKLENISAEEYFSTITEGGLIDENGDVYTLVNPAGKYTDEFCGQEVFEATGTYDGLSQPFPLKNGGESFSAKKGDIDWEKVHMVSEDVALFDAVWRTCVEGEEPQNPIEERVYNNMKNRMAYLEKFPDKESYIRHSCAFWCYGIVNDLGCLLVDDLSDIDNYDRLWVAEFYDRYIAPLPDDAVITLYDIKLL